MTIGLAIIGLGAAVEPHLKALAELSDRVEVHWAVSRSAARLATFASQAPYPTTTDLASAIADPKVDAILLLTPPGSHLTIAGQAFAAGKHVLVEKPLELDAERAGRLVQVGRASGRSLGVVLQHRFRPGAIRLREMLRAGRLGAVQAASLSVPWWRPQGYYDPPSNGAGGFGAARGSLLRDGGGVLMTQAIHSLDLFRELLGVRRVLAATHRTTALHRMETEDHAAALVELDGGGIGSIVATTAAYPGRPERIEIIGAAGGAVLDGLSLRCDFLDGSHEEVRSDARTGSGASVMDFDHGPHRAVIADFLDAIEQGRDPAITGESVVATQRLIEEMLASDAGR